MRDERTSKKLYAAENIIENLMSAGFLRYWSYLRHHSLLADESCVFIMMT